MPIRRSGLAALLLLPSWGAVPAWAEAGGPVYKDAERHGRAPLAQGRWGAPPPDGAPEPRLGRPVTFGPGYAGSDYGLSKPSYNGLGSRPDWGSGQ